MLPLESLPASYNPAGLSADAVTILINHTSNASLLDFSFRLLDKRTLAPISIPGNPGLETGDISPWVVAGSVEMNTQRDVHRQATLDMVDLPGLAFDPLFHRIQVFCDFYDRDYTHPNATRLLHWPIGVFMGILNQRDITDNGVLVWHLTMYDETYRLSKLVFSNDYVAKAGRTYTAVMQELCLLSNSSGVTPDGCRVIGPGLDPARVHIPQDGDQIPIDIVWKSGKDIVLNAINQLASSKPNLYYPLWEDEVGGYYSAPMPYYTLAKPSLGWTYDSRQPNIVLAPVKQVFSDWSTIFNYVKILCEPAKGRPFWAEATNNSADSAVSVPNLDETVPMVIHDDAAPDATSLALKASVLLQQSAVLNDTITYSTLANPAHQVHDSNAIYLYGKGDGFYTGTGPDIDAGRNLGPQLVSSAGYNFEEISWSMNLNTREMVHTCGKQVEI